MNILYGITKDNVIITIEHICHCEKCIERGMYEAELKLLDGSFYDMVKLNELRYSLKFISDNYHTVSKMFQKLKLSRKEKFEFILKENWNFTKPVIRNLLQYLIDKNEELEKALDKACYELGVLDNNLFSDEQWKEWCMKNE